VFGGVTYPKVSPSLGLGYRQWVSGRIPPLDPWGRVPDSAVRVPSDMLAMGDNYLGAYNKSGKFEVYESSGELIREFIRPPPEGPQGHYKVGIPVQKRHGGRLNVTFCDGHVEAMKPQRLFFSKEERDLRMWNIDNEPHPRRLTALR
jgi:prepilin-type processing-associated H-X9-DG protein